MPPKKATPNKRYATKKQLHDAIRSPRWNLLKSRRFDPPAYNDQPVFSRKVRHLIPTATANTVIAYNAIVQDAGPSYILAFNTLMVKRIDIWAGAAAAPLEVMTFIISDQFRDDVESRPDRRFSDFGVTGARRPHLSLQCPLSAQRPIESASTATVLEIVSATTGVIIDFYVDFYFVTPSGSRQPPATTLYPNLNKLTLSEDGVITEPLDRKLPKN